MRLTGGLDRGRRLRAPRGAHTRPTAAKVREAIFNILGPPPEGSVLDLYAGTGALGIEALSRGALRSVFVERDHQALVALRRNLRELGLEERSVVIGAEVCSALRRLSTAGEHFSWVFLDPPYAKETEGVLAELSGGELLAPCAVVVVEHDRRHRPPGAINSSVGGLFLTDRRMYGDTELSFFRGSGS
jgi:16S rRNA (guanine966-N2)-methyltransferase